MAQATACNKNGGKRKRNSEPNAELARWCFFRDNNQEDQDRTDCKRTVSKDVNKMDLSWEEATAAAEDRSSTVASTRAPMHHGCGLNPGVCSPKKEVGTPETSLRQRFTVT